MKRFFRPAAFALVLSTTAMATGCFGSFALTRTFYEFNRDISDNDVVTWLVFLVMVFLPVYELGVVVDVVLLNTIEFWTGSNLIAKQGGSVEKTVELADGKTLHMHRLDYRTMTVEVRSDEGVLRRTVQLENHGMALLDADARRVGSVEAIDGALIMRDVTGAPVREVSMEEAVEYASQFETHTALATAAR